MRNFLFLSFLLTFHIAFSQNTIGIPAIVNHSKEEYRAGNQNWDIAQDADGIVYFANNDGLLSYDGTFWRLYTLPNHVIARSVAIGQDHRIYVGGQEEFGYFSPAPAGNGDLAYTSLKGLIPQKDNDFADVWDICLHANEVFFRSNRKIFRFADNRITVYKSTNWGALAGSSAGVFAYEFEKGLVAFRNGTWLPVLKKNSLPPLAEIRSIIPIGADSLLVASFTNGLYILHDSILTKFSTPAIDRIAAGNISGALLLEPDRLALITNLAGCVIIDKKGRLIRSFTKEEGLQNNNIQAIHMDKDQNCWLALDNGIDMIAYNNAITHIFPEKDDRNAGYTSILYKGRLYLGASTGLYSVALDSSRDLSLTRGIFERVENTKGQVWHLSVIHDRLLVGHTKGALSVTGSQASFIDNKTGFWTFLPLHTRAGSDSSAMLAGTYNGINIYQFDGRSFVNPKIHAQFESAKFVAMQDGPSPIVWIAHSYKGLYKVTFDKNGLPIASVYHDTGHILSPNHNHLFRIRQKIVLTTDKGIFEYSNDTHDFLPSASLTAIFGRITPTYLKEDPYGNIWFVAGKHAGVVELAGAKPRIVYISQMDNLLMTGGYEHINIIDSNNIFIAAEKGFFHLNYARYTQQSSRMNVLIRHITSISGKDGAAPANHVFSYQGNSLHFEYSAPLYAQQQNIVYSYFLKGFDKEESVWTMRTEKDYTNLPEGDYTFMVRCRNTVGNESAPATWSFTIRPPWYRTWWAWLGYTLAFAGLLYWFYKRQQRKYARLHALRLAEQQRKYDEEQQQVQFLHQLAISRNEKEIVQLKNEMLQGELSQKNKELAANAMGFVQKGELLARIKEDLTRMKQSAELEKDSKDFKKIIRIIDNELDNPHDWEQFALHFDSVHTNYLRNLKERFPDLSASELKLCAFLRLSLSSKEISQLMNISIRGVETSRYRLRKKLELASDDNLVDFLMAAT